MKVDRYSPPPRTADCPSRTSSAATSWSPSASDETSNASSSSQSAVPTMTRSRARVECASSSVDSSNAPGDLKGIAPAARRHRSMSCGSQCSVARAFKIDHVNERRRGRHESRHELLQRLAKENAVVVALFEAHGVVTEDVEGGDELHSSELAY